MNSPARVSDGGAVRFRLADRDQVSMGFKSPRLRK